MTREEALDRLLEEVRKLPPMTPRQVARQRVDWAYGNLACTTNHRVPRSFIERVARDRCSTERPCYMPGCAPCEALP